MTKLKTNQFNCFKCRDIITCRPYLIQLVTYKNPKYKEGKVPALKSKCPNCSCNVSKFIRWDDYDIALQKYN